MPIPLVLEAADPDGDDLWFSILESPDHGTVEGTPPSVVFHPSAGYEGADSFRFSVSDGSSTRHGTVLLTMGHPSTSSQRTVNTFRGEARRFSLVPADTLSSDIVWVAGLLPVHGTVTVQPEGDMVYSPDSGFAGGDSFSYLKIQGTDMELIPVQFRVNVYQIREIDFNEGTGCAVNEGGAVRCWGSNHYGELGLGQINRVNLTRNAKDVDLGTGRTVREISIHKEHVCALLDDGAVKCWGRNVAGSLGQPDAFHRGDHPAEMGDSLPEIDFDTSLKVESISKDCAIFEDGSVRCWGEWMTQSDTSLVGQVPLPGPAVAITDGGGDVGVDRCALLEGGSVSCWQVTPDEIKVKTIDLGSEENAVQLASGGGSGLTPSGSFCALLEGGSVKCWGPNANGVLGTESSAPISIDAPHQMGDNLLPIDLGAGRHALALAMTNGSRDAACALLDDHTVKCWGKVADDVSLGDDPGEMGDALPVMDFGGSGPVERIFAGGDHVCAEFANGSLRCRNLFHSRVEQEKHVQSVLDFGVWAD